MFTEVYVDGRRVRLDPSRAIGKGGEADIYSWKGHALKVFKSPDHPDYDGLPSEQRAAEARLSLQQKKLRVFPTGLPPEVVAPEVLATDRAGQRILGYRMRLVEHAEPLLRYGDASFRRAFAPARVVVDVFRELGRVVHSLHAANAIIGDFNDLNVLVTQDHRPHIIDTDSFQFGGYPCTVFTERFVDPRLCDPSAATPILVKPYDTAADWYAYSALLLQCLLLVGPYGGVHRPKGRPGARPLPHGRRPLERVTVFHSEVQYPKPAIRPHVLPDTLLHWFHGVFERDERTAFPTDLLDELVFVRCATCGIEHARPHCPECQPMVQPPCPSPSRRCRRDRVFSTHGIIVHASTGSAGLSVVHHEDGRYRREDGTSIYEGPLYADVRARTAGQRTMLAKGGNLFVFEPGTAPRRITLDTDGRAHAFDANAQHLYWATEGRLVRDAASVMGWSSEAIGDVLAQQTHLWVGPTFGLGFYRAGNLSRVFLFDAERKGINDELPMPRLTGELVDTTCSFDHERAWLFIAARSAGRIEHHAYVYSRAGALEASAHCERGDGTWLGTIGGACAVPVKGGLLFAPTDDGIVRLEVRAGRIELTRRFDETEPYVHSGSRLLVGPDGLLVVGAQEIYSLIPGLA